MCWPSRADVRFGGSKSVCVVLAGQGRLKEAGEESESEREGRREKREERREQAGRGMVDGAGSRMSNRRRRERDRTRLGLNRSHRRAMFDEVVEKPEEDWTLKRRHQPEARQQTERVRREGSERWFGCGGNERERMNERIFVALEEPQVSQTTALNHFDGARMASATGLPLFL